MTKKELLKSSICGEVRLLASGADAAVEDETCPCLTRQSFEMKTSKLHGFELAFEEVRSEADWRPPKGQNSRSWKSKVKWALLDMHDPEKMRKSTATIDTVDKERAGVLAQQQTMQQLFHYL